MRRFACLAAALLGLAACGNGERIRDAAPAAPAESFTYQAAGDISGYYMPMDEVSFDRWSFEHVFVGQAAEFEAWDGGERSGTFAPIMLVFDDVTSPMMQTELGETRSVSVRVLPTVYAVDDVQMRFEGRSPELGRVIFDGRMDQGALATSRRNLGDEGVVMTGSLRVGDSAPRAVRLLWWMGD